MKITDTDAAKQQRKIRGERGRKRKLSGHSENREREREHDRENLGKNSVEGKRERDIPRHEFRGTDSSEE